MRVYLNNLRAHLFIVIFFLAIYTLLRIAFLNYNQELFTNLNSYHWASILRGGLRFDLSAILMLNGALFLFTTFPYFPFQKKPLRKSVLFLMTLINSFALAFEVADIGYYQFQHKRINNGIFGILSKASDSWALFPQFIKDFWYLFIVALLLFYGLYKILHFLLPKAGVQSKSKESILTILLYLLVPALMVTGIRGGLQLKPIGAINAIEYAPPALAPAVYSATFNIIKSFELKRTEKQIFMSDAEANRYVRLRQQHPGDTFKRKNVVIIVWESLSSEYTGLGSKESFTPFFDSISHSGLLYTDAYANGTTSAEGVIAVLSGIPSLIGEPFMTSIYGTNHFTGLAGCLQNEGYATAFFHGGTNGTMNFDLFAKGAGYKNYYGRTEYHNEKDFDGHWGIWDMPYLNYFGRHIDTMPQPFFASVFTLSSHHPFNIPPDFKNRCHEGSIPILKSTCYADAALKSFFEYASRQSWFNQTLFVITADHTGPVRDLTIGYPLQIYKIPILFYTPDGDLKQGRSGVIAQQIDIMPTILDYLGYNKPYFSFGRSLFSESDQPRQALTYTSGMYQSIWKDTIMQFNGNNAVSAFNLLNDKMMEHNIYNPDNASFQHHLEYTKAFLQVFDSCMVDNKLTIEPR